MQLSVAIVMRLPFGKVLHTGDKAYKMNNHFKN